MHGNGVDLGTANDMWKCMAKSLPIHVLLVEYPGYGMMSGNTSCQKVCKVADHVYDFVTSKNGVNIPKNKLFILGKVFDLYLLLIF